VTTGKLFKKSFAAGAEGEYFGSDLVRQFTDYLDYNGRLDLVGRMCDYGEGKQHEKNRKKLRDPVHHGRPLRRPTPPDSSSEKAVPVGFEHPAVRLDRASEMSANAG
jgi:hypothetical protein